MIVIGVGGNVGTDEDLRARFRSVRSSLEEVGEVRSAPLYRTAPIGPAQPPFLNTALGLLVDGAPHRLLARLQELELDHGRRRRGEQRFGPRTLDLDILVWGDRVIATQDLVVPHPRLHERRFALEPLVGLVGDDAEIPGQGRAGALLAQVRTQQVELVIEAW